MFKSAIILAGGQSLRMGFDKQKIVIKGQALMKCNLEAMAKYFDEIIIVTNRPAYDYSLYDKVRVIGDTFKGFGPISGLEAGLSSIQSKYAYVMGCDVIFDQHIAEKMYLILSKCNLMGDVVKMVVAEKETNYFEPFNGLYAKSVLFELHEALEHRVYSLQKLIRVVEVKKVLAREEVERMGMQKIYLNFNTRDCIEDYVRQSI